MRVQWSSKALSDVVRLHEFLASANAPAAARIVKTLVGVQAELVAHPRIGERIEEFDPREVRRIQVGHYEMRYDIRDSTITILRIWHTREER